MRRRWLLCAALAVLTACGAATVPVASVRRVPTVQRAGALRVPILLYHHIGPVSGSWTQLFVKLPTFSRQMAALSTVRTMTVHEVFEAVRTGAELDGGAIAVTFDDGTEDQYLFAWPLLQQYRIRATFYVAPGLIGRPGYMTWEQVREIARSGLADVEAHTVTHPDLTRIPSDRAKDEIVSSRALLERQLGVAVRGFAYPFGAFDEQVVSLVRGAGYQTAVTTRYGWGRTLAGSLTWGRIEVHDGNLPANLADLARMSGSWIATPR